MTGDDVLLTTAEVAVAFAGFASIVTAFRRRDDGWSPQDAIRFQLMIHASLFVVAFALLPLALSLFRLEEPTVWTASTFCFLLGGGALLLRVGARAVRLARERSLHPLVTASSLAGAAVALGLQALFLAGFFADRAPGHYVAGLLCVLVVAGLAFARMVTVGARPGDASER